MRKVAPYSLWLGHVGDVRDLRRVLDAGIAALVDVALNEPAATITRELAYCRFPLMDGSGNAPGLLRAAVEATVGLLHTQTPTLVYCASGMSRSLAIAAAAVARISNRTADECLGELARLGPHDVSPALWQEVCAAVGA
jgi:protein-tyrosine phosphatase